MESICIILTIVAVVVAYVLAQDNSSNFDLAPVDDTSRKSKRSGKPNKNSGTVRVEMKVGGQRYEMATGQAELTDASFVTGDEPLKFKGRTLASPLYYVAKTASGTVTNPSTLLADKSVADQVPHRAPELPYWPSYETMRPEQRAKYLEWLAGGRKSEQIPVGYAFVFFYGLERRLLEGKNRASIRSELTRLLGLFGQNRSFRMHATNLLTFDVIRDLEEFDPESLENELPLSAGGATTTREALSVRLAAYALSDKPLSTDLAFTVAERDPRSTNSVVLERTRDEAKELFRQKYEKEYGTGLSVDTQRNQTFQYSPGGSSLSQELQLSNSDVALQARYPDPLSNTAQFTGIVDILENCIDELRSYSREVREAPDDEMTVDKWESLPSELQEEIPHPEQDRWTGLIREHLGDDGVVRVPVDELVELCDVTERDKLRRSQCRSIAETAAAMGFAVEPDPHVLPQSWALDDKVALIQTDYTDPEPRGVFKVGALLTYLALYIASADEHVDKSELTVIQDTIEEMLDLQRSERRRLDALARVLGGARQTMRGVSKRVENTLNEDQRKLLGELLAEVAAADDEFDDSEETYLERAYKALDLNPDEGSRIVERHLSSSDALEEPVTVRAEETVEGEQIPSRDSAGGKGEKSDDVTLNTERIAEIKRETRGVAEMLGQEFTDEHSAEDVEVTSEEEGEMKIEKSDSADNEAGLVDKSSEGRRDENEASAFYENLSERHRPLVQDLLEQQEWSQEEFREVAREHGLMTSAAVAAINEWADEQFGGFLIQQEDDGYRIRTELIDEVET